jgi:hypothetical protein
MDAVNYYNFDHNFRNICRGREKSNVTYGCFCHYVQRSKKMSACEPKCQHVCHKGVTKNHADLSWIPSTKRKSYQMILSILCQLVSQGLGVHSRFFNRFGIFSTSWNVEMPQKTPKHWKKFEWNLVIGKTLQKIQWNLAVIGKHCKKIYWQLVIGPFWQTVLVPYTLS